MSASCPESRGGLPPSLSWPQFLQASLLRSGQEMVSREAESGPLPCFLTPNGNGIPGTVGPRIMSLSREDKNSFATGVASF